MTHASSASGTGQIHVGISGWRYEGWRGTFYPPKWPQKNELDFASRAVETIEINGTHYSLQTPASFMSWYAQTPPHFVFSVKGARYLTHMLRFRDETATVACANFFAQGVLALNEKLGPFLWQFPPNYSFDAERLERFLALLPKHGDAALALAEGHDARVKAPFLRFDATRPLRHAIEVRHASFRDPAFIELLRRYGVALVTSHSTEPWPYAEDVTADFAYFRLHGSTEKYGGAYEDSALDAWAKRLLAWSRGKAPAKKDLMAPEIAQSRPAARDVFCYFDNDKKTEAPYDARRLMTRLGKTPPPLPADASDLAARKG
ncbi:DUF72 domain-containing protein [Paraburkholderia sp. J41]|uniref:DUF72 domain-containing protein n=1 Tax=Paraburkholderia sp. J41 TaxID=2805433 RepID=UPI002AC33E8C|nr:DUF72 domain-containing protein [Paraburkholderia sp. J41]